MLSMTTGVLPEGFTTEDVEKEIDLATGWPTQWWSRRRVTITMDEGEMQTIGEKAVTITDE
jgi:hypothetical protein